MPGLMKHLALVSESNRVRMGDLLKVAAALQKQTTRDLAPIWDIAATVVAYETLEDVPTDYWPMIIRDDIGMNAAGVHLDNNRQPFALITSSDSLDTWSLTASHETMEMLVDPFGDRLAGGDSPKPDQSRVNFLVEVCDPSEAADFAYTVNGILVSDFYTPRFFDPVASSGVRYSFTGAIEAPRHILRGGYLSWVDPTTNDWWQTTWFGGTQPAFRKLGPLSNSRSLRTQIDEITGQDTAKAVASGRAAAGSAKRVSALVASAADGNNARAAMIRECIKQIVA